MDLTAARRAVEHPVSELALEVCFHLEQLEPKHLGLKRDRVRAVEARGESLVNKRISLRRLLGHSVDGPLEDVTVSARGRQRSIRHLATGDAAWNPT